MTVEPAAPKATTWFSARALSKRYGAIQAASAMDLDIESGEVHGLIGPNGAGKSTLVKMLAGVVRPDGGAIELDGTELDLPTPVAAQQRGIVLMPQEMAVVADRNLVENITLGAEPTRYGLRWPAEARRRAEHALGMIGLEADPDSLVGTLASAEQRMLMLARAIDRKVRLLILDEPTAGLPPREAAQVADTVRRLASRDITVLYVSHHLSEVAALCDRVTCIRGGRIVATLTGDQVHRESLLALMVDTQPSDETTARTGQESSVATPEPSPVRESSVELDPAKVLEMEAVSGRRVRDISLTARPGEITGVTGLLGSGLIEFVALIIGSSRPLEGSISVGGKRVVLRSPGDALRRGIAYVSGDRGRVAFTELSIKDNVSISALNRWFGRIGLLRRGRERKLTAEYLAKVSVKADASMPLRSLSGGNQQRALVARLLAADANILVLEDPTVGVDVSARLEIWEAIRALGEDRTVILVGTEPEDLVAVCDRVVCLRGGSISAVLERGSVTEQDIANAIV